MVTKRRKTRNWVTGRRATNDDRVISGARRIRGREGKHGNNGEDGPLHRFECKRVLAGVIAILKKLTRRGNGEGAGIAREDRRGRAMHLAKAMGRGE